MTKTDPVAQAMALTETALANLEATLRDARLARDGLKKAQQALRRAGRGARPARKARGSKSGFAAPVPVSDDMCRFLGVEPGTRVARTEVTKRVNAYIKDKGLQSCTDKGVIVPDACLEGLLGSPGASLTYFTLQKALNPHFSV